MLVNGLSGTISWREDGTPLPVLAFTVVAGRITDITVVTGPAKLPLMTCRNQPESLSGRSPSSVRAWSTLRAAE